MLASYSTEPFFLNVMFSSLGLFKQVDCPETSHCSLPSCIFSHQHTYNGIQEPEVSDSVPDGELGQEDYDPSDDPRKRQKVSHEVDFRKTPRSALGIQTQPKAPPEESRPAISEDEYSDRPEKTIVESVLRPISPPPLRGFKGGLGHESSMATSNGVKQHAIAPAKPAKPQQLIKAVPVETLNPRMIANPPAPHTTRLRLITMIHEQMSRLNELVKKSDDTSKAALELSPQELIRTVLNEEEKAAKKNPSVYANVLKLRIVALKKMEMPAWKAERLKLIESEIGKEILPKSKDPKPLETGLSSTEEIAILPKLAAKQDGLAKHGYVTTQISEAQIQLARDGVESSNNWETCDRCHTRFQVFPSRRAEDGALTTGGSCTHHPSKARRPPPKDKADKSDRESLYLCCNEVVGRSAGCTTAPTHVFKVSEAKRLALILPFEETPENDGLGDKRTAVCFDCEMGYTTYGMELIRLTATSWSSGSVLLDTLVRPLGVVLDLNSRYSGVWPDDFTSALPSDTPLPSHTSDGERSPLPIASSPAIPRSLLFNLISPTTPLIGHALENDLNATRIIHPCIIDTCLLFPHVRGLPMRHGLKHLMKKYLDKDIQINDEGKGHDSAEDARSAGELVRVKIREMVVREGMGKDGKMEQVVGAKRALVEDGVEAVKRGMGSVGEVLMRV